MDAWLLLALVILAVVYGIIVEFEHKETDEVDPVLEEGCKTCVYYDVCRDHGKRYNCKEKTTKKQYRERGEDS